MTSTTHGVEVRTTAAEFDRTAVADAESAAEDERGQVLSQFPLEEWAELPLERSALGQAAAPGSGPTYCRLLEFPHPNLGSIRGGSAAKHIMYHHVSGEWRPAAPAHRTLLPVDAKYKRYDRHGVSAADVHQLLTYSGGYAPADTRCPSSFIRRQAVTPGEPSKSVAPKAC